jgi:PAS domain S-box-containing protein
MNELIKGYYPGSEISYKLDELSKVSFISKAITQYGYNLKEVVGKSIFDLVYPEDIGKSTFRINERRTGQRKTVNFELRLLTKQGYPFYSIFIT